MVAAGLDVASINFSHGTLDTHLEMLRNIREAGLRHDTPVAVLGDLCGPKIRLGKVNDYDNTGGMPIEIGDTLTIQRGQLIGERRKVAGGTELRVSSIYPNFVDDIQIGNKVLIEDGLLRFVAIEKNYNEVRCQCLVGGVLKSSKGINLPNTKVQIPSITDHDWQCVEWAIENDLDYLALSFVRSADDIKLLQQHIKSRKSDIQIIAKIEKAEAIADIDSIIDACHGLMVARGDLGVEMDMARVPIIQKELIRKCQQAAKPVIVATQMLNSMMEQASPTRAEVSDVANAIFDGTDAVMLSGETSVGKFPIGSVLTMAHIAEVTEEYQIANPDERRISNPMRRSMQLSSAIAGAVSRIVAEMPIELVVLYSQTGATARVFSKHRLKVPVLALSSDHRALRQMALWFGIVPAELPPPKHMDDL
ncbi:MAG TPA: pyruvate kinase, partial [Tepidisphaeraceae bacterium]|nr:pyruvate kinase [Tepidisphaeraceae bacterium]